MSIGSKCLTGVVISILAGLPLSFASDLEGLRCDEQVVKVSPPKRTVLVKVLKSLYAGELFESKNQKMECHIRASKNLVLPKKSKSKRLVSVAVMATLEFGANGFILKADSKKQSFWSHCFGSASKSFTIAEANAVLKGALEITCQP